MIKFQNILLAVVCLLLFPALRSQHFFQLPTENSGVHPAVTTAKGVLNYPWTGGMNTCQFNEVDINLDGVMDLLVFDRHGDRLMPFINGGTANTVDYTFSPEYISKFPVIKDWVKFRDYDFDGRMDIFTYAIDYPGIVVYRNVSGSELSFELVAYPFLTSFQGGGEVNILTTDVDYPGIADIDGDGDLDILVFWGLGSFVEYHQNQSMELYGTPDSLRFVEVTQCWGYFAESDESNVLYLDTCMGGGKEVFFPESGEGSRHTGSTFLLLDLDNDTDQDLLLGDVDYPSLVGLINGGTPDSAYMISQDPSYPSENKPVNLYSMPAASFIDINNNGSRDLLLSPFDPSLVTSANVKSSWLYNNTGTNALPQFDYEQQNFLQEDMLDVGSGAYPVLEDYNGDGLLDLFVSNYGYYIYSFYDAALILHSVYWSNIALYENTGTSDVPQFNRVTHDFAGMHNYQLTGLFPTFGDLDGDQDKDLVLGRKDGSLVYLENMGGAGNTMEFGDPQFAYAGIDVGEFSAPQLVDLDEDGLLDLAIGEQNGNLNYFRNIGNAQVPAFEWVSDSLGKVNVTDYNLSYTGYSTPYFYSLDEGAMELLVGSEQGKIFYYKDVYGNLEGTFTESDSLLFLVGGQQSDFFNGIRTAAVMKDLTNDGALELLVGNYSGGIHYYSGTMQPAVSGFTQLLKNENTIKLWPNPVQDVLHFKLGGISNKASVSILDVFGNVCLQTSVSNPSARNSLEVSSLKPGVYLLRIRGAGSTETSSLRRFVKAD